MLDNDRHRADSGQIFKKSILVTFLFFLILSITFLLLFFITPCSNKLLYPENFNSMKIVDRNGVLLREVLSDENSIAKYVSLKDISHWLINATITIEDKKFHKHIGVDFNAMARAVYQNITAKKVISGGSTITMQLVRNIYNFDRKSLIDKVKEVLYALKLERKISKEKVLELYLNRISYGNQIYGIEAASRIYFNKPPLDLSLAQAAFLSAIPQVPSVYDPLRAFDKVKLMQKFILKKMFIEERINHLQFKQAVNEHIVLSNYTNSFLAPHFCDFVLKKIKDEKLSNTGYNTGIIKTTLDMSIQTEVEKILRKNIKTLKEFGVTNGAVIVMENRTGEILAMVGSINYFNKKHGQVNGALSLRQPGSAMKPFTYALALEKGFKASDIIPDIETHIKTESGTFIPKNYDEDFHGPVRLRVALASSYNIPAVRVLDKIGYDNLYNRLHDLGFASLNKPSSFYGLGLTLGSGEVTLLELVRAYSALARNGIYKNEEIFLNRFYDDNYKPNINADAYNKNNHQVQNNYQTKKDKTSNTFNESYNNTKMVYSERISYIITDILSDNNARSPSFGTDSSLNLPFKCAAKTGTSKSFRDNWTIGYAPEFTVGVWVGNFEGTPMFNVSGITGAGPIFRDIMLYLKKILKIKEFDSPSGIMPLKICPSSGELPGRYCPNSITEIFISGNEPKEICTFHRKIKTGRYEKVYEVYPSIYYSWMKKRGIEIPPILLADTHKHDNSNNFSLLSLRVIFPNDDDIFRIDPHLKSTYQSINLKAQVPEGTNKITWWINNKKIKDSYFPFSFIWQLQPGKHEIIVKTEKEESLPVSIIVY